jgi:hypothetical protein
LDIVGSAVLVIEPSRAESKRGMQTVPNARQKPRPRVHVSEGSVEGLLDELIEDNQDGSERYRLGRRVENRVAGGTVIGFNDR